MLGYDSGVVTLLLLVVTAGALASLAGLAPGRIAAALSVGGSSVKSIGLPTARLVDFRRDFEVIARLLRGERFAYNRREIKLTWANPGLAQGIQLSVQAHGPKGQRMAGELGVVAGFSSELPRLDQCINHVAEGRTKAGGNMADMKVRWSIPTSLSDQWEAIKEHRLTRVATFIRERYDRYRQGAITAEELPVDADLARQINEGYQYLEHASTRASHAEVLLTYPDDAWRRWLYGSLAGTPEDVLPVLRDGLRHACIEEVVLDLHVSTERLSVESMMETFARRVRPFL